MMEQIRNATKSWLAIVIVGLLIVSFAMWGVQDVFSSDPNDPVAVIGDQEISQAAFAQEYNLVFRQARAQRGGQLTQAEALAMNLDRDALNNMIRRTVVDLVANRLGLTTSNQMLQQQINSNPAFAGPTGQFEQRSYFEALAQAGYTPSSYETSMRNDLTRSQLLGSIVSGLYVPPGLASAHYEYAFEQRELEYFLLPVAAAGDIADPGDEVLQAYFEQSANQYRAPEYRALTLLKLSAVDLAADMDVPDEDVETLYNIRSASLQVPERRRIEQLTFAATEDAEVALNLLRAGGTFQNVGGTYIDLGDLAEDEGIDEAVMEAAFALTEPGLTDVVEGALSTSIVRVTGIEPGRSTPFEAVRDELRLELATQTAGEEIFAISEHVQDMLAGGEDLAVIGDQLNVPIVTTAGIDRNGLTPDGEEFTTFMQTPGLIDAAFELSEGEDSGFRDTPNGDFYVVLLDNITPSRTKAFDEVREQVLDNWRDNQIDDVLSAMADDAAARINNGEELAAVAASLGRDVRTTPRPIRRGDTSEVFSNTLLNTLFTEPAGMAAASPVFLGSSYVVAQVTEIIPADPDASADQVATLRSGLEDRMAAEIVNLYVDSTEEDLNVRINEEVLSQVLSTVN
jgi:peptidyl-prolyl cis-trans isomerase D